MVPFYFPCCFFWLFPSAKTTGAARGCWGSARPCWCSGLIYQGRKQRWTDPIQICYSSAQEIWCYSHTAWWFWWAVLLVETWCCSINIIHGSNRVLNNVRSWCAVQTSLIPSLPLHTSERTIFIERRALSHLLNPKWNGWGEEGSFWGYPREEIKWRRGGPVAQRIRARGYEPRCRGFESLLAHSLPMGEGPLLSLWG